MKENNAKFDFECCKIPKGVEARTVQRGSDRRAFSNRKFKAGEVILRNLPTSHTLLSAHQQERCAHCLSKNRKDATEKTKLLRCGGCKKIWYCSRECQKKDFFVHKFECKQSLLLFPSEKSESISSSDGQINNTRLLVRNFIALHVPQNSNDTKITQCRLVDDCDTVSCGSNHFDNLLPYNKELPLDHQEKLDIQRAARALWNQREAINSKSADTIIESLKGLEEQLDAALRRFRANNFGVTDSMVKVVASAVYPLGALLNHSCAPNCLLRYDLGSSRHAPPIMEIVAARDLALGEELTHSYVELVSPRNSRRESLKEIFGFDCHCEKCAAASGGGAAFRIPLPNNHGSLSPIQLSQWVLQNYNPSNCKKCDNPPLTFEDQEIIFRAPALNNSNYKAIVEASNAKQQQGQYFMVTGNLEGELASLDEAVQILVSALERISNASGILPLSLDLYKARCTRLGALIVAGGGLYSSQAIAECEHIVAFLCLALKHVPNHSLLGLQLFTLGDIYEANGEKEKAVEIYTWARRILRISQGSKCDMVLLLNEKIRSTRGNRNE